MDIVKRCSNYLSSGGLFNPEFADHDAVRDLVINCRDEIERLREALRKIADEEKDCFPIQTARDALKERE